MKWLYVLCLIWFMYGCTVSHHPEEQAVQTAADFLDELFISTSTPDYGYKHFIEGFKHQLPYEKYKETALQLRSYASTVWIKADSYDVSQAEKQPISIYFLTKTNIGEGYVLVSMGLENERWKVVRFKSLNEEPRAEGSSAGTFEKLGWKISRGAAP